MNRGVSCALLGLIALAGGCASPARYVQRNDADGTGIVAIPSNTNAWPSYNRREALAKIQEHIGPNFEIVSEGEVVTGQTTTNDTRVNTEQSANRRNPALPNERQTISGVTTSRDVTEWHMTYRRVPGPMMTGGMPNGVLTPAGGVQPMQGPAPGVVPNVQPASFVPSRGGPTSYFAPSTRPTSGAVGCST